MTNGAHSNPLCKCDPCTCKPVCTCGLDVDNPVELHGEWNENDRTMTYTVKLKAKA